MFTGIIEATARVLDQSGTSVVLERPTTFDDIKIGSSIAVSGVCLSVTQCSETSMTFDVMPITLEKTTLGSLQKNDHVNLERAMKMDGRFEGHIVQGHIDGTGIVTSLVRNNDDVRLIIALPDELLSSVVLRGSITIDGVALTVAELQGHAVTVGLIPITRQMTTLGQLKEGERVNIETDIIMKYLLKSEARTTTSGRN